MSDDDLTLHIPVHSSLYELLQLEARRLDYDCFEECIRGFLWARLHQVHRNEFRNHASPAVGINDETARRMQLVAELRRDAGNDFPWGETVDEFLGVLAEPIDEGHENVRPEWADGYGDAE